MKGKTIIVTGGAGALGQAVSRVLFDAGANIAVADQERPLHGVSDDAHLLPVVVDLTNATSASEMVRRVQDRFERIDGLICIAGGVFGDTRVGETPLDEFRHQFELNTVTAFTAIQAALPALVEGGGGSIACVSSRPALRTVEGSVAQAVSKLGVLKLVELVAEEYRHENVRANAIVPSIIDTPANRKAMPKADHSKWISPTAIGEVLRFLMSDEARIVSGATIPVYGEV